MKKLCLLLAIACCVGLFGCTEPEVVHTHTFGEWKLQENATCAHEGREERRCTGCGFTESQTIPALPHELNEKNICKNCRYVEFDKDAELVELGVICDEWYVDNLTARFVWDLKVWNGKLYRAAGDYDKNSGSTMILTYDIAKQSWAVTGYAADEAIHSFEQIGGTLYAPGIDATGGWDYGNFYVLQEDGTWKQTRNLPNGVHCFDMIEHDGKIFAGLGTETVGNTVAVSADGGKTFTFAPLYKDGQLYKPSGCQYSRTYEFVKYNGQVYALVRFMMNIGGTWEVFRYEDGKMHYMANGFNLLGASASRKYFCGEFEFNGACYIASGGLTVVTDFSDPENWKKIPMPGKETVIDAFLRDGTIYVLASVQNRNPSTHFVDSYKTVIYKSTTGTEGSFEEVLSFDYWAAPMCFDYDGTYFYIGTGTAISKEKDKTGMVLRAKAPV